MARSTTAMKKPYTPYSDAYFQKALAPVDRICVAAATRKQEIHGSQLSQWRSKALLQQGTPEREKSLLKCEQCHRQKT